METPVLSKKQQKKTLSAKKGQKETIKNVLASPYSNYFPLINNVDAEHINGLLKKLPKLKPDKVAIPWSVMKDVAKEERKKVRETYYEKIDVDDEIRQNLIFGINDVTSLLEQDVASSVLISADVNPQFMVRHVIDLSVLKKVPVLVVPELKDTLKKITGIRSLTVAIKNTARDGLLTLITDKIKIMSENYPVPKNHVHYEPVACELESNVSLDENMQHLDLKIDPEEVVDFYLYRNDVNSRVFVPELSKPVGSAGVGMDVDGFIAFNTSEIKCEAEYKGLKVKRVRNNKERRKKFKSR